MLPLAKEFHSNSQIMTTQQATKKSIGVFALQLDGMGDIIGGAKVAAMVQQIFPAYEVIFSVVQPSLSLMEKMMFASNKHVIDASELSTLTDLTFCKEKQLPKKIDACACMIIYPTYHDSTIPKFIRESNVPMLRLREYGAGQPTRGTVEGTVYPLGVGKEDYGLILDPDLYAYGEKHRGDQSLQRLAQLQFLPSALTKLILGRSFNKTSLEEFAQNNKLFSGYGYHDSAITDFIEALCTFNSSNNLTICLLNQPVKDIHSLLRKTLFNNNFKEISIYTPNEKQGWDCKNLEFKEKTKGNRKCKLIFAKLEPAHSLTLAKASEPQTLTTGDQSFIERLLLRHYPLYDCRPHKIPFIHSIIESAKQLDKEAASLLQTSIFGNEDPLEILQMIDEGKAVGHLFFQPNLVNYFKKFTNDQKLGESWNNIVTHLYQNHNAKDLLQPIIAQALPASRNDQLSLSENTNK